MKVIIQKNQQQLLKELKVANNYFSRLAGLMFRQSLPTNTGLLITPCKQIHTHFMKFAVDVIFIDSSQQIVHIERSLKPWKFTRYYKEAKSVIEINQGEADFLEIGDTLKIVD